jgi:hypothetical protein
MNDKAFDADHYSIHKNHQDEKLDRDITVEMAEHYFNQNQKEQNKRLYELEVNRYLLSLF